MNRYQTLERRLGALIVDLIVVAAPIAVLDLFIRSLDLSAILLIPWLLISTFTGAGYNILLQGWYGQTLGKMLLGVMVVRNNDEGPISVYEASLREIPTMVFDAIAFASRAHALLSGGSLDFSASKPTDNLLMFITLPWVLAEVIVALKTRKRRAIHDFIAGTVVVRTDFIEKAE